MKTKQQILKMTKEELNDYKWSDNLNKDGNSDCFDCDSCYDCIDCFSCCECSHCSNCSDCDDCSKCFDCYKCSDCSYCYNCRNAEGLEYAICNVEVGKKEYEKKMKELNIK